MRMKKNSCESSSELGIMRRLDEAAESMVSVSESKGDSASPAPHERVDWKELVMTLSVSIFAFSGTWIGWVVFFNGYLCHLTAAFRMKQAPFFRGWDIVWNVFLCVYVNAVTYWQPWTILLTIGSLIAWTLNQFLLHRNFAVHIFLVQLPLFVALMFYENASTVQSVRQGRAYGSASFASASFADVVCKAHFAATA